MGNLRGPISNNIFWETYGPIHFPHFLTVRFSKIVKKKRNVKKKWGMVKKMGNAKKGVKTQLFQKSLKKRGKIRNCEQKTQKPYTKTIL